MNRPSVCAAEFDRAEESFHRVQHLLNQTGEKAEIEFFFSVMGKVNLTTQHTNNKVLIKPVRHGSDAAYHSRALPCLT